MPTQISLRKRLCVALDSCDEWKSSYDIAKEINGYRYTITAFLKILNNYGLVLKKKVKQNVSLWKLSPSATLNDLFNILNIGMETK